MRCLRFAASARALGVFAPAASRREKTERRAAPGGRVLVVDGGGGAADGLDRRLRGSLRGHGFFAVRGSSGETRSRGRARALRGGIRRARDAGRGGQVRVELLHVDVGEVVLEVVLGEHLLSHLASGI